MLRDMSLDHKESPPDHMSIYRVEHGGLFKTYPPLNHFSFLNVKGKNIKLDIILLIKFKKIQSMNLS